MSNNRYKGRLTLKLILPLVGTVVLLGLLFSFIIYLQSKDIKKQIEDKLNLFSSLLSSNLDKLISDNLLAYQRLQEVMLSLIKHYKDVQAAHIISDKFIVLATTSPHNLWQKVDAVDQEIINEIIQTKKDRSLVITKHTKELVVHFMPMFDSYTREIIGIMKLVVRFPTQRGSLLTFLRQNKSSYFKQEATFIARDLRGSLQKVLQETERNFNYLNSLISNMLKDRDIQDIKVFSKDLRLLGSGKEERGYTFLTKGEDKFLKEAMSKERSFVFNINNKIWGQASPLYVSRGDKKRVEGAIGITISSDYLNRLITQRRNNILSMSIATIVLLCMLIIIFFRRVIMLPIKELNNLAEHIGAGDLSYRAKIYSNDELGKLAATFNAMVDKLAGHSPFFVCKFL